MPWQKNRGAWFGLLGEGAWSVYSWLSVHANKQGGAVRLPTTLPQRMLTSVTGPVCWEGRCQ